MDTLKKTIADLDTAIQEAQQKQKDNDTECKKLQKDMDEFKNNKDGKIEELKVLWFSLQSPVTDTLLLRRQANISKQKSAAQKQAVDVKSKQKDHQSATLELGPSLDSFDRIFDTHSVFQSNATLK